jgi:hypothetical protein
MAALPDHPHSVLYCTAWPVVLDVTGHSPLAFTPARCPGDAGLVRSLPPAAWETSEAWERVQGHSRVLTSPEPIVRLEAIARRAYA